MKTCLMLLWAALVLPGMTMAQTTKIGQNVPSSDDDKPYNSPQRFRLGEIVGGGVSRREVVVFNESKVISQANFRKKAYAVVRVKLDPGRSISIHDFTMIYNYQSFDCVAVKPYQNSFNAEKRIFTVTPQSSCYDLLFFLDVPNFANDGTLKVTLHYRLSGGGLTDIELKLRSYGSSSIQLAVPREDDSSSGDRK